MIDELKAQSASLLAQYRKARFKRASHLARNRNQSDNLAQYTRQYCKPDWRVRKISTQRYSHPKPSVTVPKHPSLSQSIPEDSTHGVPVPSAL